MPKKLPIRMRSGDFRKTAEGLRRLASYCDGIADRLEKTDEIVETAGYSRFSDGIDSLEKIIVKQIGMFNLQPTDFKAILDQRVKEMEAAYDIQNDLEKQKALKLVAEKLQASKRPSNKKSSPDE
jgi:hypothetical protein